MELLPGKSFNIQASSCIDALRNFETSTISMFRKLLRCPVAGCEVPEPSQSPSVAAGAMCSRMQDMEAMTDTPLSLYRVSFQSSSNALLPAVAFADGTDAVLIKLEKSCKMPQTRGFHYSKSPYREVENEVQTPQHSKKVPNVIFGRTKSKRSKASAAIAKVSPNTATALQQHSFFGALPHRDTGVGGYSNLYIKKRIETGVSPFPSIHLKI